MVKERQNSMDEEIVRFLQQQTCATICVVDENGSPYCFNCMYAFTGEFGLLYFKSSADTHHAGLLKTSSLVAGTILPDKLNVILPKGVQFNGLVLQEHDPLTEKASLFYHKKFPIAIAVSGEVWTIRINRIKMTDSTKGFRKKITWASDG